MSLALQIYVLWSNKCVLINQWMISIFCACSSEEESEKVSLKLSIQKTKIIASSLITSWQIDGERVETVADFIFQGSKITADGICSHEIKRGLLLGRKVMTSLHIKNQRHYFANKGPTSQSYDFSSSHMWMGELDYKES